MRFQFRLIPTLMVLPSLIIIFTLAFWQMQRLQWKEALIEKMTERAESVATALPAGALSEDESEFLPFTVRGVFDHSKEIHLVNRSLNGNPGIHVITPLVRSDGQGVVMINRGWAPFKGNVNKQENRLEGLVKGEIEVTGLLRFPKGKNAFIPENEPQNNVWFYLDMAEVGKAISLPVEAHYLVSNDEEVPGGYPLGKQWHLNIVNNHLQYAITWFSLGITLLVIFLIFSRRKEDEGEEA